MTGLIRKMVVRKLLKEHGFNTSDGVFKELEEKTMEMVEMAATRAQANKRKTVFDRDV